MPFWGKQDLSCIIAHTINVYAIREKEGFEMKHTKKLLSLLLVLVMAVSLANGFVIKAANAITVTIRMEQDETTLLAPVEVTLTEEDKNNNFGLDLLTTGEDATYSPLRAFAKYLSTVKGVKNEDMKNYIIVAESDWGGAYVNGLSINGDGTGAASTNGADSVSWMYDVNDALPNVAMDQYELKDQDDVVFYGLWYSSAGDETLYSVFDQKQYTAEHNKNTTAVSVSLNGIGYEYDADWNQIPYTKPVSNATIYVAKYQDASSFATEKNAIATVVTDQNGKASLPFTEAGKYVLSASRKAKDGVHYDISRPYATVTITEPSSTPTAVPTATPTASPTAVPTASPTVPPLVVTPIPDSGKKTAAPAKPKSIKVIVRKSKAKRKKVTITWKKVKKATGYQLALSTPKKKRTTYKKVKKNKVTLKCKKGTYYVKIRAYKKQKGKTIYGKYSRKIKFKVKKAA